MISAYEILQRDYETALHYTMVQENLRREEQMVGRGSYGVPWELYKDGNQQITSDKFKLENVLDDQSPERRELEAIVKGRREKHPLLVLLGYHLYKLKDKIDIDDLCRSIFEKGLSVVIKSEKNKQVKEFLQMVYGIKSQETDNKGLAINLYRAFNETRTALDK
jgi:hypothetical protein